MDHDMDGLEHTTGARLRWKNEQVECGELDEISPDDII
jgi:hypothetical protein